VGIKTNLQILERAVTPQERKVLAETTGVPEDVITMIANIADLSRLPWASKATIANLIGAGYGSIARLVNANPDQLYKDFFNYGKAIGKNLKMGNEVESSYRIARLVPELIVEAKIEFKNTSSSNGDLPSPHFCAIIYSSRQGAAPQENLLRGFTKKCWLQTISASLNVKTRWFARTARPIKERQHEFEHKHKRSCHWHCPGGGWCICPFRQHLHLLGYG
jgi:hypothetical protein